MPGVLGDLLREESEARALGQRGRAVFAEQAGATGRTVEVLAGADGAGRATSGGDDSSPIGLLRPLAPLYGAAVAWKRRLYARGAWRSEALEGAVISVGSLSAGGAGKTPMVLLLAEMLGRRGYAVRILTRGYGRGSGAVERVDPAGDAWRGMGMSRCCWRGGRGCRCMWARTAVEAGRMAAGDACGRGRGVPAGRWISASAAAAGSGCGFADAPRMWRTCCCRRAICGSRSADVAGGGRGGGAGGGGGGAGGLCEGDVGRGGTAADVEDTADGCTGGRRARRSGRRRPLVFCGVARPEGFFAMLEAEGIEAAGRVRFPDHHAFGERDVTRLVAEQSGARERMDSVRRRRMR